MGHAIFPFASLGAGLNLRDKADAVAEDEAIDLMDVDFTEVGVVKERAGYTNFTGSALTNRAASLEPFYKTDGTKRLVAGCGTRLEVLNTSGSVVASGSATGLTDGIWDFVRFGGPNAERVYAGQGNDTLRRWDESAFWTAPAGMPRAGALALMPVSNRLVAGRFNTTTGGPGGVTSSPSHVYFSAVGDPETWDPDDFIQITPGDGEKVQAIVTFENRVFVFKETKFAVVYGETEGVAGGVEFDFFVVNTGGVGLASPRAVAVAENGIYFLDRRGVFFTDGNAPVLVSDAIRPIFQGGSSVYYTGGELDHANITNCAAHYHNDRLYLAFPTSGANNRVLVWDDHGQRWSLYDLPAAAMTTFRIDNDPELVFARASGSNHIDRHNSSLTSDAGAAITSHWRGGWFDLNSPVQKRVAECKFWGAGTPYAALSTDYEQSVGALVQLNMQDESGTDWGAEDWGTFDWAAPRALIPQLAYNLSGEGTHFSLYLENELLDSPWAVHRANYHVSGEHIPSVIGSD